MDGQMSAGTRLLLAHLPAILDGSAAALARPQDDSRATHAAKARAKHSVHHAQCMRMRRTTGGWQSFSRSSKHAPLCFFQARMLSWACLPFSLFKTRPACLLAYCLLTRTCSRVYSPRCHLRRVFSPSPNQLALSITRQVLSHTAPGSPRTATLSHLLSTAAEWRHSVALSVTCNAVACFVSCKECRPHAMHTVRHTCARLIGRGD